MKHWNQRSTKHVNVSITCNVLLSNDLLGYSQIGILPSDAWQHTLHGGWTLGHWSSLVQSYEPLLDDSVYPRGLLWDLGLKKSLGKSVCDTQVYSAISMIWIRWAGALSAMRLKLGLSCSFRCTDFIIYDFWLVWAVESGDKFCIDYIHLPTL